MIKRNNNAGNIIYHNNVDTLLENMYYFWGCRSSYDYISELMLIDILLLPLLDSKKSNMPSLTKVSGNNNYIDNTIIYKFSNNYVNLRFLYITYSKNTYIVHIQNPAINTITEIGQTQNIFEILYIIKDLSKYESPNNYERDSSMPYYNNPLYINYFLTHVKHAW